ncbi:hypothetical protein ILUMI_24956 [Ignelater luminosus]|uniref:Uncharacterized protein n=1 Tax=Ignelater luminosus TaxID=2038154 RepID=A0A8K0G0H4_IGNLU|nr:hypothetical protein ILUMI_24956 [Ignelater luminosus]
MVTLLETEKTRDVLGLSVRGTLNIVDTDKKNRKEEFIYKPEAIVFYNELKMGIDSSDQLASYLTVLLTKIFNENMGLSIVPTDIDRSHRLKVRSMNKKARPIIVKFTSYKSKMLVLQKKSMLKNTPFTMQKGLTGTRYQVLHKAFQHYKPHNVWTRNGTILIKSNNERHRITTKELEDLLLQWERK